VGIETKTYIAISVVMFLQFAIWGAWAPVLATRLLGPLKMSGKQTGWIYATLPLACIIAPLISGWLADQIVSMKYILIGAHLVGAVLLFLAAKQAQFKSLFVVMLLYSTCYAATLPLVNSVLFTETAKINLESIVATTELTEAKADAMPKEEQDKLVADTIGGTQGKVFLWAPVAWALIGWSLTGWRMTRKTQGDGSDCLYFAAGLSLLMAAGCFLLTAHPLAATGEIPIVQALTTLGDWKFLVFILVSMVVAGLMQFYFLGSAQFMQDSGISSKHVPASMALAQIAQAAATFFLLGYFLTEIGFKWTLVCGGACWALMYAFYVVGKPKLLIIVAQPLHGLAYVFFIIVGQIYAENVADESIRSSMQALIFVATTGIGLFFGTQFAGIVMDKNSVKGKFQWAKIWIVPGAITLVGVVVLALLFQNPDADAPAKTEAPAAAAEQD
jgi:MFS family permease